MVLNIEGSMTVEDVLNTPTNHISMISNMYVNQSKDWFKPGMYSLLIYSWFVVRFFPHIVCREWFLQQCFHK